jgi:hypothetical protein
MAETQTKKVYSAIAAVAAEIAKIGCAKDRKNPHQGWSFRGIDDVYNALAPILPRCGLVIIPSVLTRECDQIESGGKRIAHSVVSVEFALVATADGSEHRCVFFGEAMDYGDKATGKAMTYAHKAMLQETFCIPTEASDDPDAEVIEPKPEPTQKPVAKSEPVVKVATISEEEQATIAELIEQSGANREDFLKFFKISGVAEMRVIDYSRAVSLLRAKLAKGGN